ncbi:MAG: NAD(P)/FAD-dependent oxidoreductase [Alphaproteobacteria bacterium]|nr:NAD(P)/FAD-dependent oxidoreductase [Alphaproteobacteria bacterium]
MKKTYDVVIIGAGASGLFCGIESKNRGKSVCLIDHGSEICRKVKISGGGRCNFTNLNATWHNYLSENPKFCISALAQFSPHDFLHWVQKKGLMYTEKSAGQLFCKDHSQSLIDLLKDESQGVNFQLETTVKTISKLDNFQIETSHGMIQSKSLIIATGGLSYPVLGATDFGHKIAKQFGHKIIPASPALVPFILSDEKSFKELAGISLPVRLSIGKKSFEDSLLFTHRGISGPAVLQISSYWQKGQEILVNFYPQGDVFIWLKKQKMENPKKNLSTILSQIFPTQFAKFITQQLDKQIGDMKDGDLQKQSDLIQNWKLIPSRTAGYTLAEVTRGGVDTNEISSQTMESKKVSRLYFIGEVLDVTGWLGGYNLQWAWSSGYVAGKSA